MKTIFKVLLGVLAFFVLLALLVPVVDVDQVKVVDEPIEIEEKSSYKPTGIVEGMEEAKQLLTELDKINQCTKICAGEDYSIPVIRNQWKSACNEIYYYLGEEGLDERIMECEK